jgi:hypothetical protein
MEYFPFLAHDKTASAAAAYLAVELVFILITIKSGNLEGEGEGQGQTLQKCSCHNQQITGLTYYFGSYLVIFSF